MLNGSLSQAKRTYKVISLFSFVLPIFMVCADYKYKLKSQIKLGIINGISDFSHFINDTLKFFYYQWYPCIIERFTTVISFNFFRSKLFKTINFLLCIALKNKRKRKKLTVLDGKKLKRFRCKTLKIKKINFPNKI